MARASGRARETDNYIPLQLHCYQQFTERKTALPLYFDVKMGRVGILQLVATILVGV